MQAIIAVAGKGTRMYPLGITLPKALISILNKPLLRWTLENLENSAISEIILVVSADDFGQQIRSYVKSIEGDFPRLKFSFVEQEKQLGTGHVLMLAAEKIIPDTDFLYLNGDDLYGSESIKQVITNEGATILGKKVSDPEKWGILQVNEANKLISIIEKPTENVGDLANTGCVKLTGGALKLLSELELSVRGEYEITDLISKLATQDAMQVIHVSDYWIPIGYPWHILEATEALAPTITSDIKGTLEANVTINGKLILPASSKLKSGTYIDGNIVVGENVVIGPNAHLRQNVVIGDNSNIGFGVEIKNSVLGNKAEVAHLSYIGDSVLGNEVRFSGMSITANLRHDSQTVKTPVKGAMIDTMRKKLGAIIGDKVKLGVSTKIYPGRKIWPNNTTLPGEVVDKDIID